MKDRLVIITGGAGLLGRKYTEAIIEAGGDVVVFYNALKNSDKFSLKFISKKS